MRNSRSPYFISVVLLAQLCKTTARSAGRRALYSLLLIALMGATSAGAQTESPTCETGPPTLSGTALRDELKRSDGARLADLVRLEQVKREIADARAALKLETERLEDAIARAAIVEAERRRQEDAAPEMPSDPIARKKVLAKMAADRARLAKALKSMPPPNAARLLRALDRTLAADLLAKMRPQDAGMVLAAMPSKEAAALAAIVAGDNINK